MGHLVYFVYLFHSEILNSKLMFYILIHIYCHKNSIIKEGHWISRSSEGQKVKVKYLNLLFWIFLMFDPQPLLHVINTVFSIISHLWLAIGTSLCQPIKKWKKGHLRVKRSMSNFYISWFLGWDHHKIYFQNCTQWIKNVLISFSWKCKCVFIL